MCCVGTFSELSVQIRNGQTPIRKFAFKSNIVQNTKLLGNSGCTNSFHHPLNIVFLQKGRWLKIIIVYFKLKQQTKWTNSYHHCTWIFMNYALRLFQAEYKSYLPSDIYKTNVGEVLYVSSIIFSLNSNSKEKDFIKLLHVWNMESVKALMFTGKKD